MENILKNPGLRHLAENIFWQLSYEDLENCRLINQSSKKILKNQLFWRKKLIPQAGLFTKKNQPDWVKILINWPRASKRCRNPTNNLPFT